MLRNLFRHLIATGFASFMLAVPLLGYAQPMPDVEVALQELEALQWHSASVQQQQLKQLAQRHDEMNLAQQARLSLFKAQLALINGDYNEAEQLASAIAQQRELPAQQLSAYALLLNLAAIRGDYEAAFLYLYQSELLLSDETPLRQRYDVLSAAGNLFSNAQIYDQAAFRIEQAKLIAEQLGSAKFACSSMYVSAKLAYLTKQLSRAANLFEQQIELCQANQETLFVGVGLIGLGRMFGYQQKEQEALDALLRGLDILQSNGFKAGIVTAQVSLAQLYLRQQQLTKALEHSQQAILLASQLQQWQSLADAYQVASLVAERQGNLDKALEFERRLFYASEQALGQTKAIRLAYLKARFSSTAEQQKINLFNTQNELADMRKEAIINHRWLIILGLFATCSACALLFVLLIRSRKEHKHYRLLSQTDSLTNIFNRRYSLELAEARYRSCLLEQSHFTVVMIDVDYFKSVNDTFGHAVGDEVLRHVATQLSQALRKRDIIGRTGGEEFAIFLPGSSQQQSLSIIERCRQNLMTISNQMPQQIEVTASYGVASVSGVNLPLETIIRRADEALYEAKSAGRNRVVIYRDEATDKGDVSQYEVML
ncbi:GGDEF domain-containing protein [Neiella marina]|uniref:diguanylate cyclase n=1 Tax=Neiella holothuriorum TaxID=2870530 RepID=A0ABS7EJU9_9GAMM|nr:tetratricopeptide repeat-containing diguanylate cyclase [Neiella holothuriorum]MBW8192624.1 GGDEF domain-containing protein [Neiella holothuriorum]